MSPALVDAQPVAAADLPVGSLGHRLAAVATTLGVEAADAGSTLDALVRDVQATRAYDRCWLLRVAVTGSFPTAEEVRRTMRWFELHEALDASLWLLDDAAASLRPAAVARALTIVSDQVLVEVDWVARHDMHTGVQRVARSFVPRWRAQHPVEPVGWAEGQGILRTLVAHERERVLDWDAFHLRLPFDEPDIDEQPWDLVVPWRTTLVLTDVCTSFEAPILSALAQYSGNRVGIIGYDAIPIISAHLVNQGHGDRFVAFYSVLKHADAVAGISESAAAEFQGYVEMLASQGLPGPMVAACSLPNGEPLPRPEPPPGPPTVLCVGSFEPRKNHLALLFASELLWREGLSFRLQFVGGNCELDEFDQFVAELKEAGRPIDVAFGVSEDELEALYTAATFIVFPSLHEGYGLPVAEALARRRPVITADFGSTAEVAEGGGTLLVDPRDDDAVAAAMRRLLTDRDLLDKLRDEIEHRPVRTWDDYAHDLWHALVAPVEETM